MSEMHPAENGERRAALISGAVVVAIVVAGALFAVWLIASTLWEALS